MSCLNYADMTEEQARQYLERLRWPDGPVCPHCSNKNIARLNGQAHRPGLYKCRGCRKQFSVTVGTIFERSHIPLRKWVMATYMICTSKKGVSALQLQRMLGLKSYKSAWFMAHRVRFAMRCEPLQSKLRGVLEADETYVGGKNIPGSKQGPGTLKTPVLALVQRGGTVRTRVTNRVTPANLRAFIDDNADKRSTLMTDELRAYRTIGRQFKRHGHVLHGAREFARGDAYTNTAESFFALLKRGMYGTFHHCGKQHLQRYCDEFAFRWDHRKASDHARTEVALKAAPGKRLMYRQSV
ncbi:MAG: IS1595 family transposase, partial [Phycisphaerae bacterium]